MGDIVQIWGEAPKGGTALVAKYVAESDCFVNTFFKDGALESVYIEFRGKVASIPSMKNSKIPGKQFMNPEFVCRLKAMDRLYRRETCSGKPVSFGDRQVMVLLICGRRSRSFDPINCADTISDWLEPATKPVGRAGKPRGWGCGLISNDKYLTILPIHSYQAGIETEYSTIIVRSWTAMKQPIAELVSRFLLLDTVGAL